MIDPALEAAIQTVPKGKWAVGVSGGADSVALLSLLHDRGDLRLHVAHLDHQLRDESGEDARFVRNLCAQRGIPCVIMQRNQIEPSCSDLPENPSSRYRQVRLALFEKVVKEHRLAGVILAHHRDDQAETIFQRLIRGSSAAGLTGMSPVTQLHGIAVLRPLLSVDRESLRCHLKARSQPWREDASNTSPQYLRNRLRVTLREHPDLKTALLELGAACTALRSWIASNSPQIADSLPIQMLADLPQIVGRQVAAEWLVNNGVPRERVLRSVVDQLILMASDAATAARQDFPRNVTVHRARGMMNVRTKSSETPSS